MTKRTVERTCKTCSKPFSAQIAWVERGKGQYCSHKCVPAWNKGLAGKQPWHNVEGLKKGHGWNKGKPNTWYNPKGLEVGRGLFKGKHHPKLSGENHWNWQGGITSERDRRTKLLEYKLWRVAVYERDGYKCVKCGETKSGSFQADHIKPWALYPELRFEVANGQTLCKVCHLEKTIKDTKAYYKSRKVANVLVA